MRYLSPREEKAYYESNSGFLSDHWFTQMHIAGIYYEARQWDNVIAYTGIARDIAIIHLRKENVHTSTAVTHLTLSSIYLSNAFQHQDDPDEAKNARKVAVQVLNSLKHFHEAFLVEQCIATLGNQKKHSQFMARHFNLPFEMPMSALAAKVQHPVWFH